MMRRVISWLGWPVESSVKMASAAEVRTLIDSAHAHDFHRKGIGIDVDSNSSFIVVPYLPEYSPKPSWMCLVAAFPHSLRVGFGFKPDVTFARLDISVADFRRLRAVKRSSRNQLLHWMTFLAHESTDRTTAHAA